MAKRIVVIQGHPDASGERFCHALADAYVDGARTANAEVRQVDVGQLEFPLLRTKADYDLGKSGTPRSLVPAQEAIEWSQHILIVYPLWHGTMPALLKGFLEQTFRPEVALNYSDDGFPKQMLKDVFCSDSAQSLAVFFALRRPSLWSKFSFQFNSPASGG